MKTSSLQHIKRESGIYALKKHKEIVYVGQSNNVYTRILEHIVDKNKDFDEISVAYNEDILKVQTMEVVVIGILKPKYNKLVIDSELFLKVIPYEIKKQLNIKDDNEFIEFAKKIINDILMGEKNELQF